MKYVSIDLETTRDWSKDTLLDLAFLKSKFGLDFHVAHDAYLDALDVIRILRRSYEKTI